MVLRIPDPYRIGTIEDVRSYLSQVTRDITHALEDITGEFTVSENRQKMAHQTCSATSNIGPGQSVVFCDASASSITVTLPDPFENIYKAFYVKRVDANGSNTVTVNCATSGVTIDTSVSLVLSGTSLPSATIYSDGSNYWAL